MHMTYTTDQENQNTPVLKLDCTNHLWGTNWDQGSIIYAYDKKCERKIWMKSLGPDCHNIWLPSLQWVNCYSECSVFLWVKFNGFGVAEQLVQVWEHI